jgi:streptogramin lyase
MGGEGNVDGTGPAARFSGPAGVTTDSAGNVYVADQGNSTIRKITPAGVVTTLAGTAGVSGSTDATGPAASFIYPYGIAADSAGNIYVADQSNNTIRKITPAAVVSTLAGTAGLSGSTDGTGAAARFSFPKGVATDSAGNLFVADGNNHTIRKITAAGVVSTLAGTAGVRGSTDGTGAAARFYFPVGVATDSVGNVYVGDSGNNTIRKITPAGVVSTLAGTAGGPGSTDATGLAARFNSPRGVATDSAGNVYVADQGNNTIRKITPAAVVSTLAGTAGFSGSTDGTGAAASFNFPIGVATDSAGNVYVADAFNNTIRKITPAGVVTTLAGAASVSGSTDGTGAAASFKFPIRVATDSAGNLYVADYGNSTIRKITPAGVVSTLAGTAGVTGSTDATGAAASFNGPSGVATDSAGNVYVAEEQNHTIRKITPAGVVTTLAGTAGVTGSIDATGAAASFNSPSGVAIDSAGNVYVGDSANYTIRKITPAGVVTTLAGMAGVRGSNDGTGAAASFSSPQGVATDSAGNVYVSDRSGPTIRKVTGAGVVSTLAGTAGVVGSTDGTGAAASFNAPRSVTTDSAGNVYVADRGNHTIRKITPTGAVSTVVGVAGQMGFAPGALPGLLASPYGLAVSGGSLYITSRNGVAVVQNRP